MAMLRLLRSLHGVISFGKQHPRISLYGVSFVFGTFGIHQYIKYNLKRQSMRKWKEELYRPTVPVDLSAFDAGKRSRTNYWTYLSGARRQEYDIEPKCTFGLIVGPYRDRKNRLVTHPCNRCDVL